MELKEQIKELEQRLFNIDMILSEKIEFFTNCIA